MAMKSSAQNTILVTGASGRLGRRIVELALERGDVRVIAGTRTPEKLADLADRAELRRLDFEDPETVAAAFTGVDRSLIVSTDVTSPPGRRVAQHRAAIEAAKRAGVEHLIYTSFLRADRESPLTRAMPASTDHAATERLLRDSGLGFTILRNSLYADWVLRRTKTLLATGELPTLAGRGGIAYITREDCARAAAAVLTSERPPIGDIELTGPEVIGSEQLVDLVSQLSGKATRIVTMSEAELTAHFVAGGAAEVRAVSSVGFEAAITGGDLAFTTDAVMRLTGTPPIPMRDFLIAAGIAGPSA
jgi:NAD(P)H dehydrogenase (quinone)